MTGEGDRHEGDPTSGGCFRDSADAADIASGAASDIYRNSGDYAQRGADAVTTTVKQYPLSALLLAAAVGFLAALLVASRN